MTHDTDALVSEQELDAEVERILAMTDDDVAAELAAEGFTDKDVEIFHWKALATAALKANTLLHDKNYKFMWQVRDTCTRAETAEAALSTARAELAECRNKALEEAATLVSGTAQALSPHILLAPDETKSALVEATVVALNSICDGIRTLKSEAPHA